MPARSLPAFGSDQPWHHVCSPAAIFGRMRCLLFLGAELEDRRREQEDAVLRDALRRARAVVLLFEDQPLPERRIASAVLLRPRHDGVAGVEQRALPLEVRGEAGPGVARGQRRARHVGLEPGAALGAELPLRRAMNERSMGGGDRSGGRERMAGIVRIIGHCCHRRGSAESVTCAAVSSSSTYPGITALDLVGPHEVFPPRPGA